MEGSNRNRLRGAMGVAYLLVCWSSAQAYHSRINYIPAYEKIDSEYIGYPATWGDKKVDYMFGNSPEANMEMGCFIRTGTPFNF